VDANTIWEVRVHDWAFDSVNLRFDCGGTVRFLIGSNPVPRCGVTLSGLSSIRGDVLVETEPAAEFTVCGWEGSRVTLEQTIVDASDDAAVGAVGFHVADDVRWEQADPVVEFGGENRSCNAVSWSCGRCVFSSLPVPVRAGVVRVTDPSFFAGLSWSLWRFGERLPRVSEAVRYAVGEFAGEGVGASTFESVFLLVSESETRDFVCAEGDASCPAGMNPIHDLVLLVSGWSVVLHDAPTCRLLGVSGELTDEYGGWFVVGFSVANAPGSTWATETAYSVREAWTGLQKTSKVSEAGSGLPLVWGARWSPVVRPESALVDPVVNWMDGRLRFRVPVEEGSWFPAERYDFATLTGGAGFRALFAAYDHSVFPVTEDWEPWVGLPVEARCSRWLEWPTHGDWRRFYQRHGEDACVEETLFATDLCLRGVSLLTTVRVNGVTTEWVKTVEEWTGSEWVRREAPTWVRVLSGSASLYLEGFVFSPATWSAPVCAEVALAAGCTWSPFDPGHGSVSTAVVGLDVCLEMPGCVGVLTLPRRLSQTALAQYLCGAWMDGSPADRVENAYGVDFGGQGVWFAKRPVEERPVAGLFRENECVEVRADTDLDFADAVSFQSVQLYQPVVLDVLLDGGARVGIDLDFANWEEFLNQPVRNVRARWRDPVDMMLALADGLQTVPDTTRGAFARVRGHLHDCYRGSCALVGVLGSPLVSGMHVVSLGLFPAELPAGETETLSFSNLAQKETPPVDPSCPDTHLLYHSALIWGP